MDHTRVTVTKKTTQTIRIKVVATMETEAETIAMKVGVAATRTQVVPTKPADPEPMTLAHFTRGKSKREVKRKATTFGEIAEPTFSQTTSRPTHVSVSSTERMPHNGSLTSASGN